MCVEDVYVHIVYLFQYFVFKIKEVQDKANKSESLIRKHSHKTDIFSNI